MIDKIAQFVAWHMPARVVYWCVIRATSSVSVHEMERAVASEVTAFDVLTHWWNRCVRDGRKVSR